MTRVLPLLLVLLLATTAHADDDVAAGLLASGDVRVRATIRPDGEVFVGQKAELSFDLMTTSFFQGAPTWRLPDIRGAITRQESQFAVNGSETIDDRTYAMQTWSVAVYPQREGTLETPAFDVTMVVSVDGKRVPVTTTVPATSIEVRQPEGASGRVIAATAFTATAALDGETKGLVVGDALRRTITMVVDDAPAMVIPPLPEVALDGAAAYASPPVVEDETNRGDVRGTRIESTSYVFERPGTYTLPAVQIEWFDLTEQALRTIDLDATTIEIAENPDLASGTARAEDGALAAPNDGPPAALFVALAALLAAGLAGVYAWRRVGPSLGTRLDVRRREQAQSEPAYFERFESACRASDPTAAMNNLLAWIDRRAAPRTGSLPAFVEAAGDPSLAAAVADLEQRLYGRDATPAVWSGEALRATVAAARGRAGRQVQPLKAALRLNP